MLFFTNQILKARKHLFWHQQTHNVMSMFFSYTMQYTFHFELPHCTFHFSLSFLLIALESKYCPLKQLILVL